MNYEMLQRVEMMSERTKRFLYLFLIWLSISGVIGFTCFVLEESMQTAMFGAFGYKTAEDWEGLERHTKEVMIPIHETSVLIIRGVGWINPIMYPAYVQYLKANEAMINSQLNLAYKKQGKTKILN